MRKVFWTLFGVFEGILKIGIETGKIVCNDDNIRIYAVIILFIKWALLFFIFYSIFRKVPIRLNKGTIFSTMEFFYKIFVSREEVQDAFIFLFVFVFSYLTFNQHFHTITDLENYLSWNEIAKSFLPLCWR